MGKHFHCCNKEPIAADPTFQRRAVFLALSWTYQAVAPVKQPGAYFLLDQLVDLRKRLTAICQDRRHSVAIPPEREHQLEGGEHGKSSASSN